MIYLVAFCFSYLNFLRGKYGFFVWIQAALISGFFYLHTIDTIVSIIIFGLFVLGESYGWGSWIGCIIDPRKLSYCDDEGSQNGIKWIARKIIPDFYTSVCKSVLYSKICLFLRGIWWFLPILIALHVNGYISIIDLLVYTFSFGVWFPLSVVVATQFFNKDEWSKSELIYGFIQGIIFVCVLYGGGVWV